MTDEELAAELADLLAGVLETREHGRRLRVERHRLPNGRELASFEVRSRKTGARAVVHVEAAL